MVILKKAEFYILVLCLVLCTTARSAAAYHHVLTIRHLWWAIFTLVIFTSITIRGDFGAVRSPAIWLLAGYVAIVWMSGATALNKSEWLYAALRAFVCLAFLLGVITAGDNRIYAAAAVMATGLGIYGLIQIAAGQTRGLDITANQWAHLLVLLLPLCWKHKWLVVLLTINIVFAKNRTADLAAVTIMFILSRGKTRYLVIAIAAAAVIYFAHTKGLISHERLGAWRATEAMITDHPAGVGAGNWKIIIPQYGRFFVEPVINKLLVYNTPHNDYLWIVSETGAAGLMAYIGFLIWLLQRSKDRRLTATIAAWMIISFFSFPLERAGLTVVMLMVAGLIAKDNLKNSPARFTLWPIALCILVFAVVDFSYRHRGNCQGRQVRQTKDIAGMQISWFAQMDETTTPLCMFRGLRKYELTDYQGAIDDFKTATRVHPNHAQSAALAGMSLINAGWNATAAGYIKKALAISPQLEMAHIGEEMLTATGPK